MYAIIDPLRIYTQEYNITDEEIEQFIKREPEKSFDTLCDKIFDLVKQAYINELPADFAFSDNEEIQIKSELLLQLLNFLSCCTSKHFAGLTNFVASTKFTYKNIVGVKEYPTYNTEKSLREPFLKNILPKANDMKELNEIEANSFTPQSDEKNMPYYFSKKNFRNGFFLVDSPLSQYIYNHIIFAPIKGFEEIESTTNSPFFGEYYRIIDHERLDNRAKYLISKENKYFLSVLLRAINSRETPYTTKAQDGMSLQSLDSLYRLFFEIYQTTAVIRAGSLECLLFLINAENIFQMSYMSTLLETYTDLSKRYKGKSFETGFNSSRQLIGSIANCPLNTLKLKLLKYTIESSFSFDFTHSNLSTEEFTKLIGYSTINKEYPILGERFCKILSIIQEMIDCFFFTLLTAEQCFYNDENIHSDIVLHNILNTHSMEKLKEKILHYLTPDREKQNGFFVPDVPWSFFKPAVKDENYKNLTSSLDDYYTFTVIYDAFHYQDFDNIYGRIHSYNDSPYLIKSANRRIKNDSSNPS
ncbi:MAG: hypothetical protein LUG99_12060 [Lachnospiraceae bacterium]|nr:hypothetical protein [Lachnospiraceae bacterium]